MFSNRLTNKNSRLIFTSSNHNLNQIKMTTSNLNATEITWNLIFIKGGDSKLKAKFVRVLKKEGYTKSAFLGCYMRHNPSKAFADSKIYSLNGVHSTLLQITDEQFSNMKIYS